MVSDLFSVIGPLGGVLVGSLTTYLTMKRVDPGTTTNVVQPPSDASGQLLRLHLEAEAKIRREEKLEDAYGKLLGWLYELEITADGIRLATWSQKTEIIQRGLNTVDNWPWTTLKPPRYVASTQHYWSDDIRGLLEKFYQRSSAFTWSAGFALRGLLNKTPEDRGSTMNEDRKELRTLSDDYAELRTIFARIREQVRQDLSISKG